MNNSNPNSFSLPEAPATKSKNRTNRELSESPINNKEQTIITPPKVTTVINSASPVTYGNVEASSAKETEEDDGSNTLSGVARFKHVIIF